MPVIERAGQRIAFDVRGAASNDARTVVLAHNLLTDRGVWNPTVDRLTATGPQVPLRTVAIDFRGHGESSPAIADYDIETLGTDLLAVLDAVGARSAVFAGASLGAAAIVEAAVRAPHRFERIALLGATPFSSLLWDRIQYGLLAPVARYFGVSGWMGNIAAGTLYGRTFAAAHPEIIESRKTTLMTGPRVDVARGVVAWRERPSMQGRLAPLTMPILLMAGDEDVACPPPHSRAIAAELPHARIEEIHAGHTMMIEQPDLVAARLSDFFGS